jgi:hypothetical protein
MKAGSVARAATGGASNYAKMLQRFARPRHEYQGNTCRAGPVVAEPSLGKRQLRSFVVPCILLTLAPFLFLRSEMNKQAKKQPLQLRGSLCEGVTLGRSFVDHSGLFRLHRCFGSIQRQDRHAEDHHLAARILSVCRVLHCAAGYAHWKGLAGNLLRQSGPLVGPEDQHHLPSSTTSAFIGRFPCFYKIFLSF